jgi:hypothetical protein
VDVMTEVHSSVVRYAPAQVRYWPSEAALILLNGVLEGEHGEARRLVDDLTPQEAARLLPCLLAVAANGLVLLDTAALESWRSQSRAALAGLPRAPADP